MRPDGEELPVSTATRRDGDTQYLFALQLVNFAGPGTYPGTYAAMLTCRPSADGASQATDGTAMSELRRWRSYTTFTELGGPKVTPAEVTVELTRLPLDGVLGFLGRLSLLAVRPDVKFFDPPFQGEYLNLAIVDDFPTRLPRAVEMYQPGRIPTTGERHLFIHQRNIAWLAHHAILNCQRDATTAVLMPSLQERCCRLLLIVNDFFAQRTVDATVSLAAGRAFALEVLR